MSSASVAEILARDIHGQLTTQIKEEIKKYSDDIIEKVACDLANEIAGRLEYYKKPFDGGIQLTLLIDRKPVEYKLSDNLKR